MKKPYYDTCPECKANLDPGERCDCRDKGRLTFSDGLIIGTDFSGGKDISVLQVSRREGAHIRLIKMFYGREAEELYSRLVGGVCGMPLGRGAYAVSDEELDKNVEFVKENPNIFRDGKDDEWMYSDANLSIFTSHEKFVIKFAQAYGLPIKEAQKHPTVLAHIEFLKKLEAFCPSADV